MSKTMNIELTDDEWSITIDQDGKKKVLNGEYFGDQVLPDEFKLRTKKLPYQILKVLANLPHELQKEL